MNAAARLVNHQGVLSRASVVRIFLTQYHFTFFGFILAIFISSLSLIYVTHTTRYFQANFQQAYKERDQLRLQWGQLLLEKSTLLMQSRIQNMGEVNLDMIFPEDKSMVMLDGD